LLDMIIFTERIGSYQIYFYGTRWTKSIGSDRTSLIRSLKSSKKKKKKKNSFNQNVVIRILSLEIHIQARISIEPVQNVAIRRLGISKCGMERRVV